MLRPVIVVYLVVQSDPDELTFSWYTSGLLTRKYYTNWEDGHPKNR
jgi:hypothetical protein